MLHFTHRHLSLTVPHLLLSAATLVCLVLGASLSVKAQNGSGARKADEPVMSEFRGVRIGMLADEARQKLGEPREKSDEQDFYVVNEQQTIQVLYDKASHKVIAVSADFLSGASDTPKPRDVFGTDLEAKADGSIYKMVRYPKAGYWVAYSRTAGDAPLVTVTIQKIQ
jgi:hypothetical protein